MKISKDIIYRFLLFCVPVFILSIWYERGFFLSGSEDGLVFYNASRALDLYSSVWTDYVTGMAALDFLPRVPMMFFFLFLSNLGLSYNIFQIILFYSLMVIGVLSFYYFVVLIFNKITLKKEIALVGSLFYLCNPYTASQIWDRGIHAQFFLFAALPLYLFLFAYGLLQKKSIFIFLIPFITLPLSFVFGLITNVIVIWVVLSIYAVYFYIQNSKKENLLFTIKSLGFLFISWGFVNAWWLLPIITSSGTLYSPRINVGSNLDTLIGVSQYFPFDVTIRLIQNFIFFNSGAYGEIYKLPQYQFFSWISPFFVFTSFLFFKKIKQPFLFFVLLFFLGLIVSLGSNPPFGGLFTYLFEKITIFQAFRNPYEKFGLVLVLGYSTLFAIGLIFTSEWILKKMRFYSPLLLVLIIGCVLFITSYKFINPIWLHMKLKAIDVPSYYQETNAWLSDHGEHKKIFFLPFGNDGVRQQWNSTIYNGVEPSYLLFDEPTIASALTIPYYFDFSQNMKKYMDQVNIVPSMGLLGVNYLGVREDVIAQNKNQEKYLLKQITIPVFDNSFSICNPVTAKDFLGNTAHLVCNIDHDGNNKKMYFLELWLSADTSSNLEIAISDDKGETIRLYGGYDSDYTLKANKLKKILISFNSELIYSKSFNSSRIKTIDIIARPLSKKDKVTHFALENAVVYSEKVKEINEYEYVKQIGKIRLYQPKDITYAPEFGIVSSIKPVKNFEELFTDVEKNRKTLSTRGYFVENLNDNKKSNTFLLPSQTKIVSKNKISGTRYWMQTQKNDSIAYIILSQSFNAQWKVIPGISKNELENNFVNNIKLLRRQTTPEDNHFVANGYANGWKVDPQEKTFAVIFLPQIYADIGMKIAFFSFVSILVFISLFVIRNKFYGKK